MKRTVLLPALFGLLLAFGAPAVQAGNNANDPVGTWLVEVSFPTGNPPPFMEFLTFHHNGTLTETNGSLHANPVPFAPLNITGSTGFGAWERIGKGRVRFTFHKMVFCGPGFDPKEDLVTAAIGCFYPGQHVGYLRVRAEATLRGNTYSGGESMVDLLIGPDPDYPIFTENFGAAASEGKRIRVQAP